MSITFRIQDDTLRWVPALRVHLICNVTQEKDMNRYRSHMNCALLFIVLTLLTITGCWSAKPSDTDNDTETSTSTQYDTNDSELQPFPYLQGDHWNFHVEKVAENVISQGPIGNEDYIFSETRRLYTIDFGDGSTIEINNDAEGTLEQTLRGSLLDRNDDIVRYHLDEGYFPTAKFVVELQADSGPIYTATLLRPGTSVQVLSVERGYIIHITE